MDEYEILIGIGRTILRVIFAMVVFLVIFGIRAGA